VIFILISNLLIAIPKETNVISVPHTLSNDDQMNSIESFNIILPLQ